MRARGNSRVRIAPGRPPGGSRNHRSGLAAQLGQPTESPSAGEADAGLKGGLATEGK